MKATLVFVLVSAVVVSAIPVDPYGHAQGYKPEPKPYSFSYGVHDDYAGNIFNQEEKSDGKAVQGSYSVQLPDGRKQTVIYHADHHKGFTAEVKYSGKAQYPSKVGPPFIVKPQKHHEPTYHDAPVYKPQPSYH